MSSIFRAHLDKFIDINDDEFKEIAKYFSIIKVKKKENILLPRQVCKRSYFVLNGCLRKFFITDKGTEQTTEFAIENWWMTDLISFEHRKSTDFCIQAVEPSEILVIDNDSYDKLLEQAPKMERYFRFIYQRAFAAYQMRIKYLYGHSSEELYYHFNSWFPEFVQRIPQYLIASYLGFTPEYLSEIRAKYRS
ncbi:Crp/Fnr family transcriptional regulator [Fulvivirga sp.]|uniref:Crp/Fnr family transcriptional regulator n=1 Tax=Fulvivirga sp. TaxID=1931237 RepID=UPI0032EDEB33